MTMMNSAVSFIQEKCSSVLDRISPMSTPKDFLAQPLPVEKELPYECFLDIEGRHLMLLKDGSLGIAWRLIPLQHEVMSADNLNDQASRLTKLLGKINEKNALVQVIFDSEPSSFFPTPSYCQNPQTPAQEAMALRVHMIQNLATNTDSSLATLMSRKIYVFFSIPREDQMGITKIASQKHKKDPNGVVIEEIDALENLVHKILTQAKNFEESLFNPARGTSDLIPLSKSEFLYAVRDVLNSNAFKTAHSALHWATYSETSSVDVQCCGKPVVRLPSGIQVGSEENECDTWQVLSWRSQGAFTSLGMMSTLLKIREPIRVVLNIRPNIAAQCKGDLEGKENRLKYAFTSTDMKQKNEVRDTLDRVAHDEGIVSASLHVLLRNTQKSLSKMQKDTSARNLINTLERELSITFILEKWAAPVIFDLCLPFGYHVTSDSFTGREQLVLCNSLTHYLPILGGFLGSNEKVQLMQSRAGNACYLSTWPSQVPHICIIGGSGAGKSVITANFLTAQLAANPDANLFIIDNKTSYTMIAKALVKNPGDAKLFYPPKNFPNLFLGDILDADRLSLIVSIIKNAIKLCDTTAHLSMEHSTIISESIKTAHEHKLGLMKVHLAEHEHEENKELLSLNKEHFVQSGLCMDDIVNCFSEVCELLKFPQDYGSFLRNKLRPFTSEGHYKSIFNQDSGDALKNDLAQINIYDLDGVGSDPILKTLTTQICMSDIIRMIKNKKNLGKKGVFLIDEAGYLLDSENNPELVTFIEEAWKTFRKLNILCMGITNSISDYKKKQACKTIWNVSPNKFILPMTSADVEEARRVEGNSPNETPLFTLEDEGITKSLAKIAGKYSQIYFRSDDCGRGTFIYTPTGCDYWLSVSKKEEIETVELAAQKLGSYWLAIKALSKLAPFGLHNVKDGSKSTRVISTEELSRL